MPARLLIIREVLTEHSQAPEELNVTFSHVRSQWTDLADQHLELGPTSAIPPHDFASRRATLEDARQLPCECSDRVVAVP